VIGFSFIVNGNLSSTALSQETLIGIYICICIGYLPYTIKHLTSLHDATRRIEFKHKDFQTERSSTMTIVSCAALSGM